jgi:hypothetical protein
LNANEIEMLRKKKKKTGGRNAYIKVQQQKESMS